MNAVGYYNGEFAPLEELKIPALDRGAYFGDGVYEAVRVDNHRFFALKEHLDRLEASLAFLRIPLPMPRAELTSILQAVADRVESDHQQLYFQITRATAMRTHAFPEGGVPNLLVFSREVPLADVLPPETPAPPPPPPRPDAQHTHAPRTRAEKRAARQAQGQRAHESHGHAPRHGPGFVPREGAHLLMDRLYEAGARGILLTELAACRL